MILAVQVWDISPALAQKRAYFAAPSVSFENPIKSEFWDSVSGRYSHMFSLDDTLVQALYPALYAADHGMTTNDGFTARFDVDYHHEVVEEEIDRLLRAEADRIRCISPAIEPCFSNWLKRCKTLRSVRRWTISGTCSPLCRAV